MSSRSRRTAAAAIALAIVVATPALAASRHAVPRTVADHPATLRSNSVLIVDADTRQVLFEKNAEAVTPIASLTKLMTAMVVVGVHQDLSQPITITDDDVDKVKHAASRLRVGTTLSRADMLHIALMSSENRAASALGRNFPGGTAGFVAAMNASARALGMRHTRYVEPTGLSSENVSSAQDLAKLVIAANQVPLIRQYTTDREYDIPQGKRTTLYHNSNHLISNPSWDIQLQKTGYISEAGRCMVMLAGVEGRPLVMIFLDSEGKLSRFADADRIRQWIAARARLATGR